MVASHSRWHRDQGGAGTHLNMPYHHLHGNARPGKWWLWKNSHMTTHTCTAWKTGLRHHQTNPAGAQDAHSQAQTTVLVGHVPSDLLMACNRLNLLNICALSTCLCPHTAVGWPEQADRICKLVGVQAWHLTAGALNVHYCRSFARQPDRTTRWYKKHNHTNYISLVQPHTSV